MSPSLQKTAIVTIFTAAAAGFFVLVRGQTPGGAAAKPREPDVIFKDLADQQEKIQLVMPNTSQLADPEFRKNDAAKVLPPLKTTLALLVELAPSIKGYEPIPDEEKAERLVQIRVNRFRVLGYLQTLGDANAAAELKTAAAGTGADALSAKCAITVSRWMMSSTDAAAQAGLLKDFEAVIKANPANVEVAEALAFMANAGAASADLSKQTIGMLRTGSKIPDLSKLLETLDVVQFKRELLDKPLAFEGQTMTRTRLGTANFKGKVLLVDFWATWCPNCIVDMGEYKKLYELYHAQGLEVLGVSSDETVPPMQRFLAAHEFPWQHLQEDYSREEVTPAVTALARKYKFGSLPAIMLIDRQGVLRFMEFGEASGEPTHFRFGKDANLPLEQIVKKLLAEKP